MLYHQKVNTNIEHLERLSRAELRIIWERELAEKPPLSLGRDILALGIAYARQERRHGGLPRPVAKELDRLLARVLRDDGPEVTASQLSATPLPRKRHGSGARMGRGNPSRHSGGGWLPLERQDISEPVERRSNHHRHQLERTPLLRHARVEVNERKFLRCAVYTRKSSEHGLEQDFNSLDAQREAAEAYIKPGP